ncbi:MAG TPA: hypothetical protein DIU15_05780 [Deltaproteobacteria bacterium]|nr:hypothetical protein [Deltaproteobacteria bacterium]HCP45528.1 hypothetical protein [Deltaproteobacteria bacterium]
MSVKHFLPQLIPLPRRLHRKVVTAGSIAGLSTFMLFAGCSPLPPTELGEDAEVTGQSQMSVRVTGSVVDVTPESLAKAISDLPGDPALGIRVLALNLADNSALLAEAPLGQVDLELEAGDYALAILDANNTPMGLVVSGGTSLPLHSDLDEVLDLGRLELDRSTQLATAENALQGASSAKLPDLIDLVSIVMEESEDGDNGVDLAGLPARGDSDGDGVPNFLDNDSNANGIYDAIEGFAPCLLTYELGTSNTGIGDLQESDCVVFDNLKLNSTQLLDGDGDLLPHTDSHIITYELTVPGTLVPNIVDVRVPMHPLFADGRIAPYAGGFSFTAPTPPAGSAWSGDAHRLHHAIDPDGDNVFTVWVDTTTDPAPALFQFEVELVTGTIATFTTRLAYVFNTAPKVHTITDGVTATAPTYPMTSGDPGTSSNPITIDPSATAVTLYADRPLVQAGGVEVCGMDFQAHVFYLDSLGQQMNTVADISPRVSDSSPCLPGFDLPLVLDTATWFPSTWGGLPVSGYKIDFTSVAPNGDNSAEFFWFTR